MIRVSRRDGAQFLDADLGQTWKRRQRNSVEMLRRYTFCIRVDGAQDKKHNHDLYVPQDKHEWSDLRRSHPRYRALFPPTVRVRCAVLVGGRGSWSPF